MNNEEIYKYLYDDCDSDDDDDLGGDDDDDPGDDGLDTQWIHEVENQIICDDYSQFIKTDITSVSFVFVYLNPVNEIVNIDKCILSLTKPNSITQNEIFQLIQKKQRLAVGRKYYNFLCMCFYQFYINDDPKSVSRYLYSDGDGDGDGGDDDDGGDDGGDGADGGSTITEYTNILSIETIYFQPLIRMFHDMNSFTVVLFDD
jgi:hypothetical protein